MRYVRRAGAFLVLALGVAAYSVNMGYVATDKAVVTARVVSLRAPIDGVIHAREGAVGDSVAAGGRLAEIVNPLVDDRQEASLMLRRDTLRAKITALHDQEGALQALRARLDDRAEQHRSVKVEQFALEADRADHDREAKIDELRQLTREMRRKLALRDAVPRVEIEQADTAVRVAAAQIASMDQQVAAARAARAAAEAGLIVEANGGSDVAYSLQRADEISVRLFEVGREIAEAVADLAEVDGRLAAEADMVGRLRAARISIPSQGMIWRLGAGPGERVGTGDLLGQVIDCGAAFLAVDVPRDRLSDLDINAPARFRLSGETEFRTGRVTAVTGDSDVHGDGALAVVPAGSSSPVASLVVSVPPSPNMIGACLVGRTARVLLPLSRIGWREWIARYLPS